MLASKILLLGNTATLNEAKKIAHGQIKIKNQANHLKQHSQQNQTTGTSIITNQLSVSTTGTSIATKPSTATMEGSVLTKKPG